jgi:hypothetical protein
MLLVTAVPPSRLAVWRHACRLRTLPLAAACILLGAGLAGGRWVALPLLLMSLHRQLLLHVARVPALQLNVELPRLAAMTLAQALLFLLGAWLDLA